MQNVPSHLAAERFFVTILSEPGKLKTKTATFLNFFVIFNATNSGEIHGVHRSKTGIIH